MTRDEELDALIEDQRHDMRWGHRVSRPHVVSFDALAYRLPVSRVVFRAPPSGEDPRHGTNAGYTAGCKCQACRRGHAEHKRQAHLRRAASTPFEQIPHGRAGYNNYLCRCPICKAGNAARQRRFQARKRLNALRGGAVGSSPGS